MTTYKLLKSGIKSRSDMKELMDEENVDTDKLFRTLKQFKTVNRFFSGIHRVLSKTVLHYLRKNPSTHVISIIDLGSGGCDIPFWLINQCRRMKQPIEVCAVDHDKRIISHIQQTCLRVPELTFKLSSAKDALMEKEYDFVISNHFLHHLKNDEIGELLQLMNKKSRIGYVCNDLRRSRIALLQFALVAPILFRSSLTVVDGLRSICRGFTPKELNRWTTQLTPTPQVSRVFPAHLCISKIKE